MKQVFKFPLQIADEQTIRGKIVQPVSVGLDPNQCPCIWAECDDQTEERDMIVSIFGTGHPLPVFAGSYLGMLVQGSFVWHVYIKPV